jgi:uncharacterized protein YjiS (DUF1127 family)
MTVMTRTIRVLSQLPRFLGEWDRRSRARRALGRISPQLLVDIGLSPKAVARECRQPFWRPLGSDLAAPSWQASAAEKLGPALPAAVRPVARPAAVIFPCRA